MLSLEEHREQIAKNGYTVIDDVFTPNEVAAIIDAIRSADKFKITFRQSEDIFAIRQFLKELPEIESVIFNDKLKQLLVILFGSNYFVSKSIYFDKPQKSNWFVAWHQDLTISVKEKAEVAGYGPWTVKQAQFAVQPPLHILKDNFTVRIHLDDTDDKNGALKVIPRSHLDGIVRIEDIDWDKAEADVPPVKAGGVMIMKPLLYHASGKTVNEKQRRVIHVEFSRLELPKNLTWSERKQIRFN
jgi:ectoine hydroxylase-related dioxygenase (phytanoyl-CoA dioxygenase family)